MVQTRLSTAAALIVVLFMSVCPFHVVDGKTWREESDSPLLTTPDLVDFGSLLKPSRGTATLYFYNQRLLEGEKGSWTLFTSEPWLTSDRRSGVFYPMTPDGVKLTVDSSLLSPGFHTGSVIISSGGEAVHVPVVVYVYEAPTKERERLLEHIRIAPAHPDPIPQGTNRAFRAVGHYSDRTKADITEEVQWVSENENVAIIVEPGLLRGVGKGYGALYAEKENKRSHRVSVFVGDPVSSLLGLRVDEKLTTIERMEIGSRRDIDVTIENRGGGRLIWKAEASEPWIVIPERETEGDRGRGPRFPVIEGGGRQVMKIWIDTGELEAGNYKGALLIRSNGGDGVVKLTVNVVSLESIIITPIRSTIPEGEQRRLSATALWSDGSRTDVSSSREGRWVNSNPSVVTLSTGGKATALSPGISEVKRIERGVESTAATIEVSPVDPRARIRIMPYEIDLGTIGPGEGSSGQFSLRAVGSKEIYGIMEMYDGWDLQEGNGRVEFMNDGSTTVKVGIRSIPTDQRTASSVGNLCRVELKLEFGEKRAVYVRNAEPGDYRDAIKIRFDDDIIRTVFISYSLSKEESRPILFIRPKVIAMGTLEQGGTYTSSISIRNEGKSVLSWEAELQGGRTVVHGLKPPSGLICSLHNPHITGDHFYEPPEVIAHRIALEGWWRGTDGYPNRFGAHDSMTFSFEGTGIAVTCLKSPDGGSFTAYLDDYKLGEFDCNSPTEGGYEILLVDNLPKQAHKLKITAAREGLLRFEEFRILGVATKKGSGNWIRLSPTRGTTPVEDFVNVIINAAGLEPGLYSENIIFNSNGGKKAAQVSFTVRGTRATAGRMIPVYLYKKGEDHFLWSERLDLEVELTRGYGLEGEVFNLFGYNTPGTAEFLAWYHPAKKSWFYSHDREAGKREDPGYVLKGSLGNIALVPLPGTRELYRFYNPDTRRYLFTLELKEVSQRKKGYRYDGIAGYVR